ncbi:calicin [Discoglossus pictus]
MPIRLEFIEKNYSCRVLHSLNSQRQKNECCNLTVHVGQEVFFVHRNVLAAISPFIRDMISNSDVDATSKIVITIDPSEMSPQSVEQLLDYCYTGKVMLSDANVEDLIRGAKYLSLQDLKDHCQSYLTKTMQKENCLRCLMLAEAFDMKDVGDKAYECFKDAFYSMAPGGDSLTAMSKGLLECPYKTFFSLTKDENLHVHNEDQVLMAIIKWVEHKPEERIEYFDNLFSNVILDGVSDRTILYISRQKHLIMDNPTGQSRIASVLRSRKLDPNLARDKDKDMLLPVKLLTFQRMGAVLDTVLVLGGQKPDNSFSDSVYAYILEENRWLKLTDMPYNAAALSATTCGRLIYISGGATEHISGLKSAWNYNTETNTWSKMADLPLGLAFHTMVTCNDSIYIIGGSFAPRKYTSKIYRFDNRKDKWISVGKMSVAMDGSEVVTKDNKTLYIVTGRCVMNDGLVRVGVVDCFDTISGEVEQRITFPIKFRHRPFVWFQGDNILNVQSHKQSLEINLQKMKVNMSNRKVPHMPGNYKLNGCQGVCHISQEKMFVCGGILSIEENLNKPYVINTNAYIYNQKTNEWKTLAPLPVPLDCAACCKAQVPVRFLYKKENT